MRPCRSTPAWLGKAISREGESLDAQYCLGEYCCRIDLLMCEPVLMPLLPPPLQTKHPFKDNNVGPLFPLTTRVIITRPLILGYKYEKLREKRVIERFHKKLKIEGARDYQGSSSSESRRIHRERLLC